MKEKTDTIKYRFTAYLETALERGRRDYLLIKRRHEAALDLENIETKERVEFQQEYDQKVLEEYRSFSMSGERADLHCMGERLQQAIDGLSDRE